MKVNINNAQVIHHALLKANGDKPKDMLTKQALYNELRDAERSLLNLLPLSRSQGTQVCMTIKTGEQRYADIVLYRGAKDWFLTDIEYCNSSSAVLSIRQFHLSSKQQQYRRNIK